MTFNNLQTEPAFITNEKYLKRAGSSWSRSPNKSLSDCCFTISNLILILACILALIFAIRFIQDDLLYTYIEHILTLRFYRQIVYVIVILPLVLLVPMFNAISGFFLSERRLAEIGKSLAVAKLTYEVVLAILIFIALIFVAPSIRYSSVASQIGYELRRHMKRRYDNDFSYEFLDRIQDEYECCDEPWYRANYIDKMPLTCFVQDGRFSIVYERTCGDVLGTLVSNRCMVIAIGLVSALVALAILMAIDLLEILSLGKRYPQREVQQQAQQEARIQPEFSPSTGQSRPSKPAQVRQRASLADLDECDLGESNEDLMTVDNQTRRPTSVNRLRLEERERETPLILKATQSGRQAASEPEHETDPFRDTSYKGRVQTPSSSDSPILARARLVDVSDQQPRAQSPQMAGHSQSGRSTPTKGVLKKSSSFQRIDDFRSQVEQEDEDPEDIEAYQRQLQRQLQGRRSLLNVRFAD